MKHVFYIHSHITYILAMSVVKSLEFPPEDVLFLYGRRFRTIDTPPVATIALTGGQEALGKLPSYGHWTALLRYPRDIGPLDVTIHRFVGRDCFTAYLPLTKDFLMQLLASHPKCYSLNIIEEGLLTYGGGYLKRPWSDYDAHWIGRMKRAAKFPYHLNRSVCHNPGLFREPERVFVLFPELMPVIEHQVERPSILHVPAIPEEFALHEGMLLVLGRIGPNERLDPDAFSTLWRMVLSQAGCQTGDGVVLVKFHPEQSPQHSQTVIDSINTNGMRAVTIPDDVSAEAIFLRSHRLKVFGLHSSLLFYAAQWGHESFSLMRLLEAVKSDTAHAHPLPKMPKVFWDAVKVLGPTEDEANVGSKTCEESAPARKGADQPTHNDL